MGDKWTPLVLRDLSSGGRTFKDLEESLHLSPRTLSQRLDKLETEAIIQKSIYCERPPRYEYSLTEKGSELLTILKAWQTGVNATPIAQPH